MNYVVLLVEDEVKLRNLIYDHLHGEGFTVITAANGKEAIDRWRQSNPDIIILDLMLPMISGWEVLKTIRQNSSIPIIILTARVEEVDKLLGLELGADDYITKPFSPRELTARLKAVLRRTHHEDKPSIINTGDLVIFPERMEVSLKNTSLELTPTEFKILLLLAENKGQVFSRLQILERVFGDVYEGYERTIDTHISNLRKKLEHVPSNVKIKTVYGAGYKLTLEG